MSCSAFLFLDGKIAVAPAIFPSRNKKAEQQQLHPSTGLPLKILHWGGMQRTQGPNKRKKRKVIQGVLITCFKLAESVLLWWFINGLIINTAFNTQVRVYYASGTEILRALIYINCFNPQNDPVDSAIILILLVSYFCGTMRFRITHLENGEQTDTHSQAPEPSLFSWGQQTKSCLPSIFFVSKVLWEHGHVHSFTDCLWLFFTMKFQPGELPWVWAI